MGERGARRVRKRGVWMGSVARLGQLGGGDAKATVAVALTVALASLAVYLLWGEPGQVSGSLAGVRRGVDPGSYRVGEFAVALEAGQSGDPTDDHLEITHRSSPDRILWATIPGKSFVAAARCEETVRQLF